MDGSTGQQCQFCRGKESGREVAMIPLITLNERIKGSIYKKILERERDLRQSQRNNFERDDDGWWCVSYPLMALSTSNHTIHILLSFQIHSCGWNSNCLLNGVKPDPSLCLCLQLKFGQSRLNETKPLKFRQFRLNETKPLKFEQSRLNETKPLSPIPKHPYCLMQLTT